MTGRERKRNKIKKKRMSEKEINRKKDTELKKRIERRREK